MKEDSKPKKLSVPTHLIRCANPFITKIGDIASQWGFWHMDQFAADYLNLFGELPSITMGAIQLEVSPDLFNYFIHTSYFTISTFNDRFCFNDVTAGNEAGTAGSCYIP